MSSCTMDCVVQVYEYQNSRQTWAKHAVMGWYLGTVLEYYCCQRIYIQKTVSE